MAVSRITTAAVQAVSNQKTLVSGALTTEGAARPGFLTAVEVQIYQQPSTSQVSQVFLKFFDNALSTDVNANHTTACILCLPVQIMTTRGIFKQKFIFPGKGIGFLLGIQMCIDTTLAGNTAASTTSLPAEVLAFFTEV